MLVQPGVRCLYAPQGPRLLCVCVDMCVDVFVRVCVSVCVFECGLCVCFELEEESVPGQPDVGCLCVLPSFHLLCVCV